MLLIREKILQPNFQFLFCNLAKMLLLVSVCCQIRPKPSSGFSLFSALQTGISAAVLSRIEESSIIIKQLLQKFQVIQVNPIQIATVTVSSSFLLPYLPDWQFLLGIIQLQAGLLAAMEKSKVDTGRNKVILIYPQEIKDL